MLLWQKWLRDKLAVWTEFMLMYAEYFQHTVPKETKHSGTAASRHGASHHVTCFHSGKIQLLGSTAMHSLPWPRRPTASGFHCSSSDFLQPPCKWSPIYCSIIFLKECDVCVVTIFISTLAKKLSVLPHPCLGPLISSV